VDFLKEIGASDGRNLDCEQGDRSQDGLGQCLRALHTTEMQVSPTLLESVRLVGFGPVVGMRISAAEVTNLSDAAET
jgi:hypothetical protein